MARNTVLQKREQNTRRRAMKKRDHADRIWHCVVDIEDELSGHCAVPTLDGKYLPPIDIPYKYLKNVDREDPFHMMINFAQWKADWRERMVQWKSRLVAVAKHMYPNDWGHHMKRPTAQMLEEAGPRPIPVEFIEACEVGNRWALGIPKADGTYYPRPKWATDDLWAQYQLLRQSFWIAEGDGAFPEPDASKYLDEEDESAAVADVVDENEEPTPRGKKGRKRAA